MITRREPLLWLQLMAVAVIPLELELLRLLLAGPALGPAPALERLLIWGLAVIGPGLLLWRRPADWGSMLLVRLPLAGRSSDQRRISALPQTLAMKVALVLGMGLLLFSFWSIDRSALLVTQMSPLVDGSRLTALLLAGPLLTLMLWQWQQLSQAIWLLTRSDQAFENLQPMSEAELRDRTMSFGLNVLQLSALEWPTPQTPATALTPPTSIDSEEPTADASEAAAPELADTAKEPEAVDPETSSSVSAEEDEPALDASDDSSTSSEAAAEPDNAKQEQSEPEEPETEETDTDDTELDPAVPEILDSAEDADAEDEPHETSASVSTEKDEPALDASDDLSTSSEAAAEPDNAKQDESEPKGPETEEPETDAEATSEPTTTTDDAESVKSAVSGSIKPEEGTTDDDGSDLDGEVTDNDLIPGGEAERHHEET
ncbi:low-complexity tail membrane protein [Synechococcus sp. NOUM97013]|uniref:low-complexity tail membrane protein n=1 Tax=Synechococcus sp. NOUM97013 TaxID=1442555 RepID=UPI001862A795|nr:putative conserved membrane protein [Synechococcus sp. NOUM97013]